MAKCIYMYTYTYVRVHSDEIIMNKSSVFAIGNEHRSFRSSIEYAWGRIFPYDRLFTIIVGVSLHQDIVRFRF